MAPSESLADKLNLNGQSQRYTCSVNTLNSKGSLREFNHYTSIHFFSDEVESVARGQMATYLFIFTGEENEHNLWSLESYNNVVRLAVCELPDVPGIDREMSSRLSDFGSDSWVMTSQRRPEYTFHAQRMDESDDIHVQSGKVMQQIAEICGGWYCNSYFVTIVSVGNVVLYITVECDTWEYETYLCGGGGYGDPPGVPDPFVGAGGEPGGGFSGYNPCDPIGPPMQIPPAECNAPCDWMDPTVAWMCEAPCSTGNSVIDNLQVQQGFTELWTASNTHLPVDQRREQGAWIVSTSNGYDVEPWPSWWTTFPCGIAAPEDWYEYAPSNTVGMVHTHPFFAGDDTTTVCGAPPEGTEDWESGFGDDDLQALTDLANYLTNHTIKGYVIDGNNIVTYNTLSITGPEQNYPRCGY